MARTILIHGSGSVVTLDSGDPDEPLRGHEMSDSRELIRESGTEILIIDGIVSDIQSAGSLTSEWGDSTEINLINAEGRCIIPSFVDSHTHLAWTGDRSNEVSLRHQGMSYSDIAESGGGIWSTVQSTRKSSDLELRKSIKASIEQAKALGTARMEAKSGYGLNVDTEVRSLVDIKSIAETSSMAIETTWLGAHDFPTGKSKSEYMTELIEQQLPVVIENNLASFADVFCEPGWFSLEDTEQICTAAKDGGLGIRLHVDEFVDGGGLELATELGAVSADHVAKSNLESRQAADDAGVMQTFLPGTPYALGKDLNLPLKECYDSDYAFSMATDYNPNCPSLSLPFVGSLAVHRMGLDPLAALVSVTRNPATTLGKNGNEHRGTIEIGLKSSMLLLNSKNTESWISTFGSMNNFKMIN
ncbi:MAG: imidazolonepropionase [Euryarchaeota archaeon]|nr:imidazolonepropionase [Euryarchaeota archaeon]|tara:strand:- start:294 stop:1541 length:1248 start_codon:yes stop_codon:yes gene_type:complete